MKIHPKMSSPWNGFMEDGREENEDARQTVASTCLPSQPGVNKGPNLENPVLAVRQSHKGSGSLCWG